MSFWTLDNCPKPVAGGPPSAPVDDDWRRWIASNLLRRCSPESMVETMARSHIATADAVRAIEAMRTEPAFLAALDMRRRHDKLAAVMGNLQRLHETTPSYDHVEKRSRVGREEFVERYVRGCRPLVLTDVAADWPARTAWTFDSLRRRYGSLSVEIQAGRHADGDYEVNKLAHRRQVNFGEFLDRVEHGEASNDEYLTANNELLRKPEFADLLADIGSLPAFCDRESLPRSVSLWVGPACTRTPLHHDTLMLLHTQIVGRKRWRLASPLETPRLYNDHEVYSPVDFDALDLHRFPEAGRVTLLDVVVEPGETMYLPLGWWHQVSSLDRCISLSYTNLAVPNEFSYDVA